MGRYVMAEKTIALPFSIDPYGKVTATSEQTKIWADRVRSVVGTTVRERVMRPNFGGNIAYSVFNTQESAELAIKTDVQQVFNTQLPLLTLNNVQTSFDEYTGIITITVTYSLPNDIVVSTNVGLVTISGNNPPIEENL